MSDIVKQAKDRADKAAEYWQETFELAIADLEFLSDNEYSQWDHRDVRQRKRANKPILQIDQLSQFVNQVSNDVRMNTPSINISPADNGDQDTSDIIEGKIREIQKRSNADEAYDTAVNFAIKSGIGFIRVEHEYINKRSFNQELSIKRVVNPCAILIDPESIDADGSDAKWVIVLDKISEEEFERRYPDKEKVSFDVNGSTSVQDGEVQIAEYFYIDESPLWIARTFEGQIIESDKKLDENDYKEVRETTKSIVRRCFLSGKEELEKGTFPGEYVPIVPVYGEEMWIDGKRRLCSLIRRSKDAQRMYNYWATIETEILMKAPKAPVIAIEGTTEDFADDWTSPDKSAVLRAKQTDSAGRPAPMPQFAPPVQIPAGIVNARQQTTMDIRSTMGLYDSFLGQRDNAVSGIAINSRQQEGDRAVFHYADNLIRSLTQVGRILLSAIPVIYSKPQIVTVIGKEETNDKVAINTLQILKGQERPYFLNKGEYNVNVDAGANYATMRKEASEFYERIFMSDPAYREIMGDLLFKYSDLPGAQAMEERMKKIIRPEMIEGEMDARTLQLAQENEQLKMGMQQMQGQVSQLMQLLQDKEKDLSIKALSEEYDAKEADRKYQIEREKIRLEEQVKTAEIAIKNKELELKAYEMGLKTSKVAMEQRASALNEVVQLRTDISERGVYD